MVAPRHTKPVPCYSGSIGLNNRVVSHRLPFNVESGVTALEVARDLVIDRTGECVTRRGYSLLEAGSFHSIYPLAESFYVAKDRESDTAIYLASIVDESSNISLVGVISGLSKGKPISYFRLRNSVFYSNGSQSGVLNETTSSPWPENTFTAETTASMEPFIKGDQIAMLAGRAIASKGPRLYFSEYNLLGLYDATRNIRELEHEVIMLAPVQTGLFVSTTECIFFFKGNNPAKWLIEQVTNYPASRGCVYPELIKPSDLNSDSANLAAMFGTTKGPAFGLSNGTVELQIDKQVKLDPTCYQAGCITLIDDTLIIQS